MPGFMFGDSRLPPVQVVLLVQVAGTAKGSGAITVPPPPPAPPPPLVAQPVAGYPAAIQAVKTAVSAAVARVAGAGGMGAALSCMRAAPSAASVREGSRWDGAINAARLVSAGAPTTGTDPWQLQQRSASTFCRSHGSSPPATMTGAPPAPIDPTLPPLPPAMESPPPGARPPPLTA